MTLTSQTDGLLQGQKVSGLQAFLVSVGQAEDTSPGPQFRVHSPVPQGDGNPSSDRPASPVPAEPPMAGTVHLAQPPGPCVAQCHSPELPLPTMKIESLPGNKAVGEGKLLRLKGSALWSGQGWCRDERQQGLKRQIVKAASEVRGGGKRLPCPLQRQV